MPRKPLDGVHDFSRFRSGECFYMEFPTNKIGPFGKEYRNDIICKCKYNGHDSQILLMLEFQSAIDRFMAVWILASIACIWLHLSKKLKAGEKLPIFLPIVIYSGTPVWDAPLSFYDLLYEMPEELRPYQGIKYFLLDIFHFGKKLDSLPMPHYLLHMA